jgi:pseudouridine-5'-phosphate glycosidase
MVLAVPAPEADALPRSEVEVQVARAVEAAAREGVSGAALTPYLLRALGEATSGRTMRANVALLRNDARVAAKVATALARG